MPKLSEAYKAVDVKRKKFVTEYVKHGNLTQAMTTAYPRMKRTSAASLSSQMIKQPDIQAEIRKEMALQGVDMPAIIAKKKTLIAQGEQQLEHQTVSPELFNKTLDSVIELWMKTGSVGQNQTTINIDNVNVTQLHQRRQQLKKWFDNIIDSDT